MEWLEIIKVRAAGTREQGIDPKILELVDEVMKAPGLVEAKVYNHASVPSDLVITLVWNTDDPQTWGSDMAHSLSQEFKRSGLVDHSVWIRRFSG